MSIAFIKSKIRKFSGLRNDGLGRRIGELCANSLVADEVEVLPQSAVGFGRGQE